MVEPIGYPTAMLAKSASELRGYGFARSARGRPRALLAPELAPEHVPEVVCCSCGEGIGGRYIRPDPTPHAHATPILGYTLIAQKKDDVLSDKFIIDPLTSCRLGAIIAS